MPEGNLVGSKGRAQKGSYGDVGKKKVKVKKKPLPVPSIAAAAYEEPKPQSVLVVHPKAGKPKPKGKPLPHGGHLPTQFEYMDPTDFLLPSTHRAGTKRDREIKAYNQTREAQRRSDNRATRAQLKKEREARRAEVRKLDAKVRDHIGKQNLQRYILQGPQPDSPGLFDYAKAIGQHLATGAVDKANEYVTDFTSRLSAGLQGRESGRTITIEDDTLLSGLSEVGLGHNLSNALHGEGFDPAGLALDLGMLMIPMKGAPSGVSAILRAALGGARYARLVRKGATVAEAAKLADWSKPVLTARAGRRAALRAQEAGKGSSWLAGKVAGQRTGRVATFIRNDPRRPRMVEYGGAQIEGPADLSRTFKFVVRPMMDWSRPVTGYVPGITGQRKLFAKMANELDVVNHSYAGIYGVINKLLPGALKRASWPGLYALRAVLKGVPLEEMIKTTADNLAAAEKAGNSLQAAALRMHLGYFKAAEKYVTRESPDGPSVLRADAPAVLADLRDAIEKAATTREGILSGLDKLSDTRAYNRVLSEQLLYHGAKLSSADEDAAKAMAAHPVRQLMEETAKEHYTPQQAEYMMTVLDAKARNAYEQQVEYHVSEAARLRKAATETHDEDLRAQNLRLAQRHEDMSHTLRPSYMYDSIDKFADELPPEAIAKLEETYGTYQEDWLFKIGDHVNPFHFDEETTALNLRRYQKAGAIEHANEQWIDENGIPIVGPVSNEQAWNRLHLATEGPEQRLHDSRFYHMLDDVLSYLLTEDKEIMGWLASQVGASPARGMLDLQKVQKAIMEGRDIPLEGPGSIGLAAKSMEEILQYGDVVLSGERKLERGARAKISDFVDSALLKTTRTWLGDEPGIAPIVIDRWGARAWGLVDASADNPEGGAVSLIKKMWGIDVKPDAIGGVSETQYEQIAKRYKEFVDYVNERGLDGRKDWTGIEIQAMDWAAVQRYWQTDPEDLYRAIDANMFRADFEVTQGVQNLGSNLPQDVVAHIARDMESQIRELAKGPGVKVGKINVDSGGWAERSNASVHVELFGLEEDVLPRLTAIAQAFDQGLVQGSRFVTVNKGNYKSKAALIFESDSFSDPEVKARFFAKLHTHHPELGGYMPTPFDRPNYKPGIVIRTEKGNLKKEAKAAYAAKYEAAARQVADEMGIVLEKPRADNLQLLIGSQHGPATAADTTQGVGGIRALRDLPERTAAVRRDLKARLTAAANGEYLASDNVVDVAKLEADEARIDRVLQDTIEKEYQGKKTDYDLAATTSRGKPQATAVPKEVPMPRMRGGRVDIQRAGELARPVERTGREYIGPAKTGREFAEDEVFRRIRASDDPQVQEFVRQLDDAVERRFRVEKDNEPWWMLESDVKVDPNTVKGRIYGLWMARERTMYVSPHAHPLDWFHEFIHVADTEGYFSPDLKKEIYAHLGISPTEKLTKEQSEDIADLFEAMVIGFDPTKSGLPKPVIKALLDMKTDVWNSSRGFKDSRRLLEALPEGIRLRLEDTLALRDEAIKFRGARPTYRGQKGVYTPEVKGLPFNWLSVQAPRRFVQQWGRMIQGKKVATMTPTDKHLEEQFTGMLIESGEWEKDITQGPLEGLLMAGEIQKMAAVQRNLVRAGKDIPEHTDDIAVPIDPAAWTSDMREQAGAVFKILDRMNSSEKISAQLLSETDAAGIEQVKAVLFPGITDGTEKAMAMIAAEAARTQTPIEGIVWVPRKLIMETGLFDKPGFKYGMNPVGKAAMNAVDFTNNIAKMLTLSLNPAYYPMNMAGQLVMMGAQQGFMAPVTLARSLVAARTYTDEQLAIIDHAAGLGQASILTAQRGPGHQMLDAVGKVTDILIDRYPRRSAFFYEARRLGYKTAAEVMDLIENPNSLKDFALVTHRTNRAMVDFRTMGRLERELATRLIFVYPWLKASAKYLGDFVADHPVQTALFSGLLYWQQDRLREAFPEGHPGYMKWYFPITMGNPETGETPYGFRLDQFFTPLQPLDLASEIAYWVTPFELPWGSNEEGVVTKLNPLIEEIAKTISGWDDFTKETVSHNFIDMLRRMVSPEERWSSWKRLEKIIKHEEHTGIYDTTQKQNWLRFFLGSIAPVNMNPEEAARNAEKRRIISTPDRTPEETADDYMQKVEEANGGPIPAEDAVNIRKWKENDIVYGRTESKYKRDEKIDTLTVQRKVVVLLLTIAELNPAKAELAKSRIDAAMSASDDEAQAAYDELRKMLGLSQLGTLDYRVSQAQLKAQQEADNG